MPIREYKCEKCGKKIERLELPSDKNLSYVCRECGGKLKRLISKSSVHFIGSGWTSGSEYKDMEEYKKKI